MASRWLEEGRAPSPKRTTVVPLGTSGYTEHEMADERNIGRDQAEAAARRGPASRTLPPPKGRGARPGSYGPRGGRGGDKGRGRGRGSGSGSGGTWS